MDLFVIDIVIKIAFLDRRGTYLSREERDFLISLERSRVIGQSRGVVWLVTRPDWEKIDFIREKIIGKFAETI